MNTAAQRIRALAEKCPLLVIAVLLLALLGPFLNKAVHIDDPLFVWSARQILNHPADFYGFDANWYGDTEPMASINCNPPATSYLFAAVMLAFGEREIALHGAMLLVAFAAAAGMFHLSKLWCQQPWLATLLAVCAPVFVVSATTLMCDLPMLAAWLWSLVLWERALGSGRSADYAFAALLAGLAVLTKYSALVLLPLLPLLGLLRKKTPGWWLLWLAVPVAMIELYQFGTARLYGRGLISAAADYASQTRFAFTGGSMNKMLVGFAYLGGCLLPALFSAPWLWSRRALMLGGGITLAMTSAVSFSTGIGRQFGLLFGCQMALSLAGGIHLLLLALADLARRRDAVSWVLASWLVSGILFAAVLNWTVSARSFLPLAPVAAILVARGIKQTSPARTKAGWLFGPVTLSAAASITVAAADGRLANSARAAARQIVATCQPGAHKLWFEGHCAFQFYCEQAGAQPVDFSRSVLRPGDLLVLPSNNSNLVAPAAGDVQNLAVLQFPVCSWLSTVNAATGAGFYGAGGLLPFVFGPAPVEKYFIFRVTQMTSFAPAESLNNLAWQLVTSPDPNVRNGPEAVWLAQRACELTKYDNALFIGTLAAAQAEAGKFDDAIATALRACDVAAKAGQTDLVQRNRQLLERYRAHKTVREKN